MNNITKLFSIFVVFIQIQIALSQPNQSPPERDPIQQLCRSNIYPSLCTSTLNLDPRSKNANYLELALISVDATSKKVNEMLESLNSVLKNITKPEELKKYDTCMDAYNTAVHTFLPAALADLKIRTFSHAMSDMKNVVTVSDNCETQFAGSSPLIGRNKIVHDIAGMSADIIRYLFGN